MRSALNAYKLLNHVPALENMIKDNNAFPVAVEIDLSNVCNHNCIWCMFQKFRQKSASMLDVELVYKLLENLKECGVKAITYVGGGEPLVHPCFEDILRKTKELGFEIGVVTNGELLWKYIDVIKECCQFVRVSIDAGNSRTHRMLHGATGGSFVRIIRSIRMICKDKGNLDVGVAFLVHPDNYYEIPDLINLLIVLGVDYLQIRPVFMKGLSFSEKMQRELDLIFKEADKTVQGTNLTLVTFNNRFKEFYGEDLRPNECLAHNVLSIISADANVYLCCQLRGKKRFSLGSLKEKSFQEIWTGEQRQKVINQVDINRCPPCRYKKYNEIMNYLKSERRHSNFL